MNATPISTHTLRDRSGKVVEYTFRQHPPDQGLEVVDKLIQMGAGPVLQMFFEAVDMPRNYGDMTPEAQAQVWADAKSRIDMSKIADLALRGIQAAGGIRTIAPMLLQYASRRAEGSDVTEPLKDRTVFAAAYQGNYAELISACKIAMDVNGFFDVFSTFIG